MTNTATIIHLPQSCCIRQKPDGTKDYWSPINTGNWEVDCSFGNALAAKCIDHITRHGDVMTLYAIMRCMVQHGKFGGVEAGFLTALVQHLV